MSLKPAFHAKLLALQDGSYDVFYKEKRYLLSKQTQLTASPSGAFFLWINTG
jgi:hypothetical protein